MTRTLQPWLTLLVVMAISYSSFVLWRMQHEPSIGGDSAGAARDGSAISAPQPKRSPYEFTLTDQDGRPFASAQLKGQIWIGSIFFTNCPGSCWKLNQALAELQQKTAGQNFRFVSITCDPENDTPEALLRYAKHFKADPQRWTFLTGPLKEIRTIANDVFSVTLEARQHSDRCVVFDARGAVRGTFLLTDRDQTAKLERLIAKLTAEPATTNDAGDEEPSAAAKRPADSEPAGAA